MKTDHLIARIDAVLDDGDDDSLDDWAYPWTDAMRWAPEGVELVEDDRHDAELDGGWDWQPDPQVHVIPAEQVAEWTAWLETLSEGERGEIAWYVVCFRCSAVGERSVTCGCERAR